MTYQILVPKGSSGPQLSKSELIAIAESMDEVSNTIQPDADIERQDILPAYEKLLGFDSKQFENQPAGLALSEISGSPQMRFLRTSYTTQDRAAILAVMQGLGDYPDYLGWDTIPQEVIEPVQVGRVAGEYVKGDSSTRDAKGWQSEKPYQRLRWQNGERWFMISLEGDSPATRYLNKEALLRLAASLR